MSANAQQNELPKNSEARVLCERLGLRKHPDGAGWFREVYRSDSEVVRVTDQRTRSALTTMYSLHEGSHQGAWRKLASDETFVLVAGKPLTIHTLRSDSGLQTTVIGNALHDNVQHCSYTVPANTYFCTEYSSDCTNNYTMLSITVSPGFDSADYGHPTFDELQHKFPEHVDFIRRFFH